MHDDNHERGSTYSHGVERNVAQGHEFIARVFELAQHQCKKGFVLICDELYKIPSIIFIRK